MESGKSVNVSGLGDTDRELLNLIIELFLNIHDKVR